MQQTRKQMKKSDPHPRPLPPAPNVVPAVLQGKALADTRRLMERLYVADWEPQDKIFVNHHRPGRERQRGPFADHDVHLVLSGSMLYSIGGVPDAIRLAAGDLLLLSPGQTWLERCDEDVTVLIQHLLVRERNGAPLLRHIPDFLHMADSGSERQRSVIAAIQTHVALLKEGKMEDAMAQACLRGLLQSLIAQAIGAWLERTTENYRDYPAWLQRSLVLIDQSYARPNLGVRELARHSAMSEGHFSRAFKRHTGAGPRSWLIQRRIEAAASMLVDLPDASIAVIAERCGFNDTFHFSRTFKRLRRLSPSAWRQRMCHQRDRVIP
jgi:AraC-like DNA-binding protein